MSRFCRPFRSLLVLALCCSCGVLPKSVTIDFGDDQPNVNAIVQATFVAMTAAAADASSTAAAPAGNGSIAGDLGYPSESIPAMYVTAFAIGTQNYRYVTTNDGQSEYKIDGLPPGQYEVVAYTVGGQSFPAGLAGGYTYAVPCGLTVACADHTLVPVSVAPGQSVVDVDPVDWYFVAGAFPSMPDDLVVPESPSPSTGGISGTLMYPSSSIPALRIVAFEVGGNSYYYADTVPGQSSYTLDGLPAGTYHVVAYVRASDGSLPGLAGGYTQMVPCGLQYGCDDHSLIDVVVAAGQVTNGVTPADFYVEPSAFPPNPAP